jgi:hypothetical protein
MQIVSGEARSGTSLMMQILVALGLKGIGNKFNVPEDHERYEHSRLMNPKGYYEYPRLVKNGISLNMAAGKVPSLCPKLVPNIHDSKEYAIKLLTPAYLSTAEQLIDKVIYVIRDPRETVYSQRSIIDNLSDAEHADQILENWMMLERMLNDNMQPYNWHKVFFVDHRDLMSDTGVTWLLCTLAGFLEPLRFTSADIALAKDCIDLDLYRSKPPKPKLQWFKYELKQMYQNLRERRKYV